MKQLISIISIADVNIGDKLSFGMYEQDTSGAKKPIEWLVLDKNENSLLVISDKGLDCIPYNPKCNDSTWETCTLRNWLNNDFYNKTFNSIEKTLIQTTKVVAHINPKWRPLSIENDTNDKIFLLSVDEVIKYFKDDEDRMCAPTEYAKSLHAHKSHSIEKDGCPTGFWWLRTLGFIGDEVFVSDDGSINYHGFLPHDPRVSVRPALWIDLQKFVN